jgi:TRAP-type C4-dicarboxylate transport system substrate-binding protein
MGASKFAELVAAKTNGRITIHVAHSEQLGNENTNMGALRTGTLDFGCLGQGALLSVAPEVAAIGLPFLFSNLADAWAALDGPVGQRLGRTLESKNLVFLAWHCNGIRQTTNNKRPITKPDDLKGLKIRTPLDSATVDMFAAMGATPQQIRAGAPAVRRTHARSRPPRASAARSRVAVLCLHVHAVARAGGG